jgi:2-polyprenyl-6-methoxyphenol hydroxylase-like FAD-dependent oxidoreductase
MSKRRAGRKPRPRSKEFAVIGGGPGGLFLARLVRQRDPAAKVTVYERNGPADTFGFGVVFSARTLAALQRADPTTHQRIVEASTSWTDMELRYRRSIIRYGGFGFAAISRRSLLRILQESASEVGVELEFDCEVDLDSVDDADIVIASDGVNSMIRQQLPDAFGSSEELGRAKYAWFGTHARFDAVTFPFVETEHGSFAAHAYPFDPDTATFIVEVDEETWRRAGMEASTHAAQAPGASDLESKNYLEGAFAAHLGNQPLLVNNSKWASFRVIRNARWHHRNIVLLGDAAHTAHFSVGSGTKMALEDAITLSAALESEREPEQAFRRYERERRPAVERTQRWALPSQRWWESFARRRPTSPSRFAFHFMTRTGAISYRGLSRRDAHAVRAAERSFSAEAAATDRSARLSDRSGIAQPIRLGAAVAPNRLVSVLPELGGEASTALGIAFARLGAGTVVVPVTLNGGGVDPSDIERLGAVAGARLASPDPELVGATASAGFSILEVDLGRWSAVAGELIPDLVARAAGVPLFATLAIDVGDPWSQSGDHVVSLAASFATLGLTGVRLVPPAVRGRDTVALRHAALPGLGIADRISTETGLTVALTAPSGWALSGPIQHSEDDWLTQAHTAIVSGRVDLLATWPLEVSVGGSSDSADADAKQLALNNVGRGR